MPPRPPLAPVATTALLALAFVGASGGAAPACAEPAAPRDQLTYRQLSAVRANPVGLAVELRVGWRRRLTDDPSPLRRDAHLGGEAALQLSPTATRAGLAVEYAPLSVVQLGLQYDLTAFHGAFGSLQSFAGPSAYYGDASPLAPLARDATARGPYATLGHALSATGLLQARRGALAARAAGRLGRQRVALRDGERAYYDAALDLLAPGDGWIATADVDVAYAPEAGHVTAGLRYTVAGARYDEPIEAAAAPGASAATRPGTRTQRLGPVLGYTFFRRPGARFDAPTVLLVTGWWLEHPYRTAGAYAAVPYVGLAFTCRGVL